MCSECHVSGFYGWLGRMEVEGMGDSEVFKVL